MDYRVSCARLDPLDEANALEPERLLWLPDTFWCYPGDDSVAVGAPPSAANGFVTFGCLNAFLKVRDRCLALWARVLSAVPESRLTVLVQGGEGSAEVLRRFANSGIDPARVRVLGYVSPRAHLERFNDLDVFLDTFPYGGHVTTHDALWMGVPVVASKGNTPISRAAHCILSQIGLESCVAKSDDEYVQLARRLAGDVELRAGLRAGLRARMASSPLTDAPRFVRNLESAYRAAWRRWCDGLPPADITV
jgi:predicted O-linked N-acetylglucosamine transferase (SPINDLY family)